MNCMGSATYYLKAKFRSHEDLKAVFPDIKQFLIEGARAEDWWRQHRSMENRGTRKEFWDQFKIEFPRIYEFLQYTGHADGDCNNDLANVMNFGSDWGIDQSFESGIRMAFQSRTSSATRRTSGILQIGIICATI